MKKFLLSAAVAVAIALFALSGFAAESGMITTDDLERRYPPEDASENEAWVRQQERTRLEDECRALEQGIAAARSAVHDDGDARPYNERAEQYYRLKSAYSGKCENRSTTLY